ncbi:MAG: GGDEF domain-containing response regulator [Thermacetogeniaceae bacterium]
MKYKVLIIDDDPLVTKIIKDTLEREEFETVVLHHPSQALDVAVEYRPDVILVDRVLPTMDGCELCRQFRRNHYTAHVPILMLTSKGETADKVAGFEAGADDYLCKPFEPLELLARLRAHIRRVSQERQVNPISGLYGNPVIEKEIKERINGGEKFAVLYLDIDNFKAYNDAYGFLQGDEVIKFLAETLISIFREYGNPDDFLGHVGGDDFVAITTPDRAEKLSRLIIKEFDRGIERFYNRDDLERGYFLIFDRRGRKKVFLLLSLSIVIVSNESRKFNSHRQVSEIAAELKKYAKTFPGSIFVKARDVGKIED